MQKESKLFFLFLSERTFGKGNHSLSNKRENPTNGLPSPRRVSFVFPSFARRGELGKDTKKEDDMITHFGLLKTISGCWC